MTTKFASIVAVLFALCAITGTSAFASDPSNAIGFETVSVFPTNTSANSALVEANNGSFVGTLAPTATSSGGFFEFTTNSVLTTQTGAPLNELVKDQYGHLFASSTNGVIYDIIPTGANYCCMQAVTSLDPSQGQKPLSSLVVGSDGLLYGTAYTNGPNSNGTVFAITTMTVTNVWAMGPFTNFAATQTSAPTIPQNYLTPPGLTFGTLVVSNYLPAPPPAVCYMGSYTIVLRDPNVPSSVDRIKVGGTFYTNYSYAWKQSLTYYVGQTNYSVSGSPSLVHGFNGADGAYPVSGLIADGNNLFGTTSRGGITIDPWDPWNLGSSDDLGTVFVISLNGDQTSFTNLHTFTESEGGYPSAGLTRGADGFLYGVTTAGGAFGAGTIFRLSASGTLTVLHSFDPSDPREGTGSTRLVQGKFDPVYAPYGYSVLYGTTRTGGRYGGGTIFKITTNGTYTVLYSFPANSSPSAPLTLASNGFFYGVTASNDSGGIFRFRDSSQVPLISFQPVATSVGNQMVLRAAAVGAEPLSYQWLKNGAVITNGNGISGATSSQLSISPNDGTIGTYSVIVANPMGSATSDTVFVGYPPVITTQPVSQTIEAGTSANLSAEVSGTMPMWARWYVGSSGDTTHPIGTLQMIDSLTMNGVTTLSTLPLTKSASFWVRVTNRVGSVSSQVALISVTDTTSPVITCPSTIVTEATNSSGRVVAFVASATDAGDPTPTLTVVPPSGSMFPLGTNLVQVTARDASGNQSVSSFLVIVRDTTPPDLTCSQDLVAEATSSGGANVNFTIAATDQYGVSQPVTILCSHTSGSLFPLGTTDVTVRAKDAVGNESSCSFKVTVRDTTAPSLNCPLNMAVEATSAAGAAVTFSPTATDTVSTVNVTTTPSSGSTYPIGTNVVNVTAVDGAGNESSCSFTITVRDTVAPIITCPADMIAEATDPAGAVVTYAGSATDTISAATITYVPASGTVFPVGTNTVTATARDVAGNESTCSFKVTVRDTTAPVLTCPANMTVEATSAAGAVATFAPTATDSVSAVTITSIPPSGSIFPIGTNTVNVTARDVAGNQRTCSFTVTVRDSTAPIINCPATVVAEAANAAGAVVTFSPTASDVVSAVTLTATPASGSTFALGTNVVNVTARDVVGNQSTCSFNVIVRDTTAPSVNCSSNIVVEATSSTGAAVSFVVTANDTVSAVTTTATPASGNVFALGTNFVSVVSRDAAGNEGTCSFTVSVRDTTPPAINCLSTIIAEASDATGAFVSFAPTATDAVSAVAVTTAPVSGSKFAIGTNAVNVTATDLAGNRSTCTFLVVVRDTVAPTISCPSNIIAEATSAAGTIVSFSPNATDSASVVIVNTSPISGSQFPIGTNIVTLTARDAAGNQSTCSFDVIVRDTTPPILTCPTNVVLEATSATGAIATFAPSATDAASAVSIVCSPSSGSTFSVGTTTVNVTATDAAGNQSSCSFVVTVRDTTPPVLSCPGNVVINATNAAGVPVYFTPTATDNVSTPIIVATPASGAIFRPGTTRVDVSAKDTADNTSSCSFYVTVNVPPPAILTQPESLTVYLKGQASFITRVDGAAPMRFQWFKNALPVSRATNASLVIPVCTALNAGAYTLVASNAAGAMTSAVANLTVTADFSEVLPVAGIYNGLFYESAAVAQKSGGFVRLKLGTNAVFSGKLFVEGDAPAFSGKINPQGTASVVVKRAHLAKEDIALSLAFDFVGSSDRVVGSLSNSSWSATMNADRNVWSLTNTASAFTNYCTLLVPGFSNVVDGPIGYGYATVQITPLGLARIVGGLADDHKWQQAVPISKDGQWPLFVPLYRTVRIYTNLAITSYTKIVTNKGYTLGSAMGWFTLTNNSVTGNLSWIKTGWTNGVYPTGFTNVVGILASHYQAPPLAMRALSVTSGTFTLQGGNLPVSINRSFLLATNNLITLSPVADGLRVSLAAKSGLWKGTFINPANTNKPTIISGAILQDQNFGGGYFIGTNQTGKVFWR